MGRMLLLELSKMLARDDDRYKVCTAECQNVTPAKNGRSGELTN